MKFSAEHEVRYMYPSNLGRLFVCHDRQIALAQFLILHLMNPYCLDSVRMNREIIMLRTRPDFSYKAGYFFLITDKR